MENFAEDDGFKIILGESMRVTEKLDLIPSPRYTVDGRLFVNIGNTGFRYEYRYKKDNEEKSNRFDFAPEGRIGEIEERSGKYAIILCTALTEIRTWLNDEENQKKFNIQLEDLPPIKVKTTFSLIDGLYKTFERHGEHQEMIRAYKEGWDLIMDIKGFVELPDEDPLITYLQKVKERAMDIEVTYEKKIESTSK